MSLCLGNNKKNRNIKTMILLKVKQGHFETATLIYYGYRCFKSISFKYLHDSVQWRSCLRVHILVSVLLKAISDLIRLSRTVRVTYFIIYEFCFTCLKVEYKRYIFQSSSKVKIIDFYELLFRSIRLKNCGFRSLFFGKLFRVSYSCKQALFSRLQSSIDLFRSGKNINMN